jgi:hypothetical protein
MAGTTRAAAGRNASEEARLGLAMTTPRRSGVGGNDGVAGYYREDEEVAVRARAAGRELGKAGSREVTCKMGITPVCTAGMG